MTDDDVEDAVDDNEELELTVAAVEDEELELAVDNKKLEVKLTSMHEGTKCMSLRLHEVHNELA